MKPLEGLVVLEFCQFLAGPSAGLKLADLGARVIKIERPVKGEACRQLSIKDLFVDDSSLLFHTINRNKESFLADLKNPDDLILVKKLIAKADIMTHNFRPGVMDKIGLTFADALAINPKIIYGTITGYGDKGPWANKPGQDLLLQSLSGLSWLSGRKSQEPVPFGLAVADLMCGNHFVQGILKIIKKSQNRKRRFGGSKFIGICFGCSIRSNYFLFERWRTTTGTWKCKRKCTRFFECPIWCLSNSG